MNTQDQNTTASSETVRQEGPQPEGAPQTSGSAQAATFGLDENIAGALCYAFGFLGAIVFLLVEKQNRFVRFHAMQSLMVFGALFALSLIPLMSWILYPLLPLVMFLLWIFLIYKAYQKEMYKLPIVGDLAEKQI